MTEPSRVEPTLQRESDPSSAGAQSAHRKVRGLCTRVAMNRVLIDVAATMLAALALAYYLRASESLPWLKTWLIAAGAISILRCLAVLAFQWAGGGRGSSAWWSSALALQALLNGALWGALAVIPAIAGELPVGGMILGLSFLVAVAVYTLAPTLAAFALFVLAAVGPWALQYVRLAYPSVLPPERQALLAQYLPPSTLDPADLRLLLGFVALLCLLYIAMHYAVRFATRLAIRNAALKVAQDEAIEQRGAKGRTPVYAYQAFNRERRTPRPPTETVSHLSAIKRPGEAAADVALREAELRQADQLESKNLESFEAFHHPGPKPPVQGAIRQESRSAPQDERAPGATSAGALPDALLTQIDELLAYTSMNAGELFVESAPFELRDALRRAFDEPIEQARAKSLQFNCTVAETVPDRLIGDAKKVQHSLANIVRNAVKFTASGSVTVEVTSAPRLDAAGAVIRFTVSDTGIGMSPEQQQSVFAGLTRDNGSADYSPPSAGFGLAVAAGFIHAMHGTIEARSAPGQGSRFDVTIPFVLNREPPRSKNALEPDSRRASAVTSTATRPPAPSGPVSQSHGVKVRTLPRSSAHVLLVEDNPDNQMLALHLLKKQGFEVSIANNGLEAVEMAAANAFDLILMDIQMPDMGGLEATAKIRAAEQGSGRRIPIIAVTAHAQDEDRQICLDAGMDDHVTKPLDRTRLFAAISAQLGGGAQAAVSSSR